MQVLSTIGVCCHLFAGTATALIPSSPGLVPDSHGFLRSVAATGSQWRRPHRSLRRSGHQDPEAEAGEEQFAQDASLLNLSMLEKTPGLVDLYTDPFNRQMLLLDMASLVKASPNVLVTASWSRGTFSDSEGQNTIMHEPVDGTEATMLRFSFCKDGSVDVIQPRLSLRTTDKQTKTALQSGAWTGWLDNLELIPTTQNKAIVVDGTAFIANGFYTQGWAFADQIASFRVHSVKSYPKNILVIAEMQLADGNGGKIPVEISFSIVALPDSPMPARPSDDRLGFFSVDYTDMGTHAPEDAHQLSESIDTDLAVIQRFNIHAAEDKQIRFYIDPTVPQRWRRYFKQGVEAWNAAFALAGHNNTMHAVLPSDPDWPADYDRDDARYSTISWSIDVDMTYALGLAKVDPRSGQILKSDIIVTSGWVHSWLSDVENEAPEVVQKSDTMNTFRLEGRRGRHRGTPIAHGGHRAEHSKKHADSGEGKSKPGQMMTSFIEGVGLAHAKGAGKVFTGGWNSTSQVIRLFEHIDGMSGSKWEQIIGAGLRSVVMHETGHSLGLRHNFKGSMGVDSGCLSNKTCTAEKGLSVSIMDYMPINVFAIGQSDDERPDMFQSCLGEYDKMAIQYGYTDVSPLAKTFENLDTSPELTKILEKAEGLPMCTDEDLESGRDPSCKQHDLSSNPVEYYRKMLDLTSKEAKNLLDTSVSPGDSYTRYGQAMHSIVERVAYIGSELVSWIGGLDTKSLHRKQDGSHSKMNGVDIAPASAQKMALDTVADLITMKNFDFTPADSTSRMLLTRVGEIGVQAVDVHEQARKLQLYLVEQLTSPDVLLRVQKASGISDSSMSVKTYVDTLVDRLVAADQDVNVTFPRARDVTFNFIKNMKKIYFSFCEDTDDVPLPMDMLLTIGSGLSRTFRLFGGRSTPIFQEGQEGHKLTPHMEERSAFANNMKALLRDLDSPCGLPHAGIA